MGIPVSNYTRTTFSDYLEFEVLYETARDLSWSSYSAGYDPTLNQDPPAVTGITNPKMGDAWIVMNDAVTSATHAIAPSGFAIPSGTKININGTVRTTSGAVAKMGGTIVFTGSFATAVGQVGTFANPLGLVRVQSPDIDAIIDETLLKLGVTDITSLSSVEQLRKLRLYGRRECWAAVMQSTAAYYDYSTVEGGATRTDVYTSAKQNFDFEDQRIRDLYNESQLAVDINALGASSGRHKVVARW